MDWETGYPEPFRFLDDEHAEIGAMLAVLEGASGANPGENPGETPGENPGENPALVSRRLFNKITEHTSHEEELMKTYGYPERELHEKYHQHVTHSIELILQLFNRKGMTEHGAVIAKHIGNKMSEEMFVDRLFAEFLAEQDVGA